VKLLNAAWSTYQREVMERCSPEQVLAIRRAFYAGAQIAALLIEQIGTLDAEEAAQYLEALEGEMAVFLATVGTTLEARI
jgi:hypothetical protein